MIKKIVFSVVAVGFAFFAVAQTISQEERLFLLSSVWKDVSTKFYSGEKLCKINWDSLYHVNLAKIIHEEEMDDIDFAYLMQRFVAKVGDGHTEFDISSFLAGKAKERQIEILPVEIKQIKGKFYVLRLQKNIAKTLTPGSEIVRINDLPTMDYLDQNRIPLVGASTAPARIYKTLYYLTRGRYNDSLRMHIKTPSGNTKDVVVRYDGKNAVRSYDDIVGVGGADTTFLSRYEDMAYLYYDSFNRRSIVPSVKNKMDRKTSIAYTVLDLRDNTGGNELIADSLLMCFLDVDTLHTYPSTTRVDHAFYAAMGYGFEEYKPYYDEVVVDTLPAETLSKGDLPFYGQPLVILTSETTASAAEDMLIALKLHHPDRAIIVGTPTAGSTGAPFVRRIGAFSYRICTRFPLLPKGMFEQGIQPDYYYERSIDEYLKGEDRIFEYVDKIMRKRKIR